MDHALALLGVRSLKVHHWWQPVGTLLVGDNRELEV